jgi:hypothetical protein
VHDHCKYGKYSRSGRLFLHNRAQSILTERTQNMSKPPKNDSQPAPSGRIAFDDRGQAVWEWRTETGTFKADIDTKKVRALQEETSVTLGESEETTSSPPNPHPPSDDPYSTGDKRSLIAKRAPRRTLDDMRKLSEEIKRARALKSSQ